VNSLFNNSNDTTIVGGILAVSTGIASRPDIVGKQAADIAGVVALVAGLLFAYLTRSVNDKTKT
jgi:hypothetical protein